MKMWLPKKVCFWGGLSLLKFPSLSDSRDENLTPQKSVCVGKDLSFLKFLSPPIQKDENLAP